MRSKEVESSIKELTEITDLVKEEIKNNDENTTAILDIIDLKSLDTALNYIEKLENLPNKIRKKIEILEKLQNEFKENEELRIKIIAYKELLEEEK